MLIHSQRITAQAIYDQYKQRFTPREKWMLRHESKQADLSATMAHFNTYNDNVIVFEAADTSDTSCMRSPRPLEPKNVQLRSQPTTTSKASGDIKPEFPIVRDRMTNISDENRDAQQPAPYSHSPRAGQAMHSGPSLPPKPQSDGSSCGGSLSPQVSGVSRPTRCTDAAVGPTGHKMSMDGFERYCTIFHDRPRMPYPSDDEGTKTL